MTRREDWRTRLAGAIHDAADRPFAWGQFDCSIFVADCILAMSGHDPMAEFRGRYSTRAGAYREFMRDGGLKTSWRNRIGVSLDSIGYAGAGDVVGMREPEFLVGIVDLSGRFIVAVTERGLHRLPLARAVCGWRIE